MTKLCGFTVFTYLPNFSVDCFFLHITKSTNYLFKVPTVLNIFYWKMCKHETFDELFLIEKMYTDKKEPIILNFNTSSICLESKM